MSRFLVRAVAGAAACAAAMAGSLAATPVQAAPDSAGEAESTISRFGYKSNVFGTKVLVDNVELRNLKDAFAQLKCTRRTDVDITKHSSASTEALPIDNDLVHISPSTSRSTTYRADGVHGVRGINTIADIALGGELPGGFQTPVLKIRGLQSVSDAFHVDGKGFDHAESFGFRGISLEIPEGSEIPPEVQDLLDVINQVDVPISEVVNQLIDLLESTGVIEIPGLGSIALGRSFGSASKTRASSEAYALRIGVDNPSDGSTTMLQLGRAVSRISTGVPSGVFRSQMTALELLSGNDALHLGNVLQRSIPCEGTGGQLVRKKVNAAKVLQGAAVSLEGVEYAYLGKQLAGGKAKGKVRTTIAKASIPAVDMVIEGITSGVRVRSRGQGQKVQRVPFVRIGSITVGGEPLALPKPGGETDFDGGVLRYKVLRQNDFYGTQVNALEIQLTEMASVVKLGSAAGRVFFK